MRRGPRQRRPPDAAENEAERFNERHAVGTLCRYWRGVRGDGPGIVSRTRCTAYVLCGTAVVMFECGGGAIALSHVSIEPITEGGPRAA